jgi:hypothetical protein
MRTPVSSSHAELGLTVRPVLDALERAGGRPRRCGDTWTALCPAHDDRRPSLSIREGRDGRVLLKCWAGCDTAAVLRALGLHWADLFPPHGKRGRWHA